MNCEQAKTLVHALADGELDAGHAREVESHVASCADCAGEFAHIRDLRKDMASVNLRFAAPERLRRNIERGLPAPALQASRRDLLKGFGFGAGLSAIAASGLFLVVFRNDAQHRLASDIVSAHLRSLQGDHLTDVQSSDQHTVKPWFAGRLDIAPPVLDLTAQGFMLIGGRLDAIDGKAVAAIVYRRRAHVINLFALVAPPEGSSAVLETFQGFNVLHWSEQGLSLWAVSDLNTEELREFADKLQAALRNGT